jgi:mitotic spindle assembly checkpoint protein MAD1
MERLKDENEALIKRLRELKESGNVTGGGRDDLVPRQSWEVVKQKEKRLLRLQQVHTPFHLPSDC